jgi:hypothetical protein
MIFRVGSFRVRCSVPIIEGTSGTASPRKAKPRGCSQSDILVRFRAGFDLSDDVDHEPPWKLRPQIRTEGWKLEACFCPGFEEPFSAPLRTNA